MSRWHDVREENRRFRQEAQDRCYRWRDGFHWWFDAPGGQNNWMIFTMSGYQHGLIGDANERVIVPVMQRYINRGTASLGHHNGAGGHSAIYVRVFTDKGRITAAYRFFVENVLEPLENYPVLDDNVLSEIEMEDQDRAFNEGWDWAMRSADFETDTIDTDEIRSDVYSYITGGYVSRLDSYSNEYWEDSDGDGYYLDKDRVYEVLTELGLLVQDDEGDYVLSDPLTQEELAQIAAHEFQMGLALA